MSIGALVLLSLALGVAAWLFFLWTVKSGQYDDPEGPKYRMLDDDEGGDAGRPRHQGGCGEPPSPDYGPHGSRKRPFWRGFPPRRR